MGGGTLSELEEFVARTRNPRWMNVALLLVIAAAMFATIFLAYKTIEAERAQREQVERTVQVLEELPFQSLCLYVRNLQGLKII